MPGTQRLVIGLFIVWLTACGDTPKQEWQLTAQGAYAVALSQDGSYAVVGSILHGGSLWRLQDGERLYNWNHASGEPSEIIAAAISPDNQFALTAERKRMVLWQITTGRPAGFWEARGGVLDAALSRGGRYVLVGQENYSAIYIDAATGSIIGRLSHNGDVNTVAISDNGRVGVTGSEDGHVRIWDLRNEKELYRFKLGDDVSVVAVSGDGTLAFGSLYYGKGKIWEVKTGKLLAEIGFPRVTQSSARFSQDNRWLLTGDTVRRVMLWESASGKQVRTWSTKPPSFHPPSGLVVSDIAFGPQPEKAAFAAFSNGKVVFWQDD
ncbi:MAG: hypothetical protein R3208_06235 [Ketobacteraceae bacterium]|nr:hypothetical protein [Ketobacteraceae bacterium]